MNKAENFDSNRCQARTERIDFSGNASIYDRRHGAFMSEWIVSRMLEVAGLLAAGSFDAAVIARLLYLIPDWQRLLLETLRVLKPGSHLLHEWGNGGSNDDWVQIRE